VLLTNIIAEAADEAGRIEIMKLAAPGLNVLIRGGHIVNCTQ